MIMSTGYPISGPALTIRQQEFVRQMTLRASVEGLVVGSTEFDPVHGDYNWVEPGVPEGDGLAVFIAYDPGWWGVAKLDSFGALMSLPPLLN